MRVVVGEPDLSARFDVEIDSDAEPIDIDQVLAGFLLSYVRSAAGASPELDCNQSEA